MATRTCEAIQKDITANNEQLEKWQPNLDDLLKNGTRGDLGNIQILRNLIADANNKLFALKAEQIQNGCTKSDPPANLYDNQTILSTSAVQKRNEVIRLISS